MSAGRTEGPAEELQRLRRDLYRPDPPAGARERYEALRARLEAERPAVPAPAPAVDDPEPAVEEQAAAAPPPARRRRLAAVGVAALAVAGIAVVGLVAGAQRGGAAPLGPALSAADRARFDRAFAPSALPWGPAGAGAAVVGVLQRADLPQLRVWDGRDAVGWLQRGTGPLHRDFGTGRTGRATAEPLSIVLRCGSDAVYTWTIRGTAPGSADVRTLASGEADRCDDATVATATLPADARIASFDLRIPAGVDWTMAIVVPDRQ